MLVRRILEISFFCFYWICVGLISLKFVYRKWLEHELKITKLIGGWPSLALFVFILIIIYMILRYCLLIVYAKCKLSEKRLIANLKKECRSLESGIDSNTEAKHSTESLLSEPPLLSNENEKHKFGKSLENLSTSKIQPILKQSKSLESILKPSGSLNKKTCNNPGNINYGNSVENLTENSKLGNTNYADLSESLKHAILKSKSLENAADAGVDNVDASVANLLQIYENFYELQNTMQRNKIPMRKAPPVPTHMNSISYKNVLTSNTKNFSKITSELKTVNEKCQAKRLW